MEKKECSNCNELKSLDEYHKGRRTCKKCVAEYDAKRYQEKKERLLEQHKEWREDNKEAKQEYDRKWREENKGWYQEYHREWYASNREQDLARKREWLYGITKEQYDEMRAKADGKCAICQEPTEKLHIDHNHETKQVRDLLCRACNHGIGNFKENIQLLEAAIAYLKKHQEANAFIRGDCGRR